MIPTHCNLLYVGISRIEIHCVLGFHEFQHPQYVGIPTHRDLLCVGISRQRTYTTYITFSLCSMILAYAKRYRQGLRSPAGLYFSQQSPRAGVGGGR